jgi:FtsZ-binding cell division protein ZapB
MYRQCEPPLLIFTQTTDLEKLNAYAKEKDAKLNAETTKITLENRELKDKIETLTNENKALQDKINALSNKM